MLPTSVRTNRLAPLAIVLLASMLFGAISYGVATDRTGWIDDAAIWWITGHRNAVVLGLSTIVSISGGPMMSVAYALVLATLCAVRRRLAMAVGIAAIVSGGAALNFMLKHLMQRARPIIDDPLVALAGYSFPSGHAEGATVFGGLLMIMLHHRRPQSKMTLAVNVAMLLWIVCVGCSRIYLGVHYPTDVLAGVMEAVAWLTLSMMALEHWHSPLTWPAPAQSADG